MTGEGRMEGRERERERERVEKGGVKYCVVERVSRERCQFSLELEQIITVHLRGSWEEEAFKLWR